MTGPGRFALIAACGRCGLDQFAERWLSGVLLAGHVGSQLRLGVFGEVTAYVDGHLVQDTVNLNGLA
jgi:hypothetical protein